MIRTDRTDGGPAFPIETTSTPYAPGMSLRDWFAGQALANAYTYHVVAPNNVAAWAYQVADAMLAARDDVEEAKGDKQ